MSGDGPAVPVSSPTRRRPLFKVLESPVIWISDNQRPGCAVCHKTFGVVRRRHHCRACGEVVCANCSKNKLLVLRRWDRRREMVRACDLCVQEAVANAQAAAVPAAPGTTGADGLAGSSGQAGSIRTSGAAMASLGAAAATGAGAEADPAGFDDFLELGPDSRPSSPGSRPAEFDHHWRIILLSSLFLIVSMLNFGVLSLSGFLLGVLACGGALGLPVYLRVRSGEAKAAHVALASQQRRPVEAEEPVSEEEPDLPLEEADGESGGDQDERKEAPAQPQQTAAAAAPKPNQPRHPALEGVEGLGFRERRPLVQPKFRTTPEVSLASVRLAFAPASGQPEQTVELSFGGENDAENIRELRRLGEQEVLGPVGDGAPFVAECLFQVIAPGDANAEPPAELLRGLWLQLELVQNDDAVCSFRSEAGAAEQLQQSSDFSPMATHRLLLKGQLPTRLVPLDALIFRFTCGGNSIGGDGQGLLCQWEQPFVAEHDSPLTMLRMYVQYQSNRKPIDLRFTEAETFHIMHAADGKDIKAPEGETSQETICFRISSDVADLTQVKHFRRGRLGLGEKKFRLGDFKARREAYSHQFDAAPTPSGMLARGTYHQTVHWTDKSGRRYLEVLDVIKICKAAECD